MRERLVTIARRKSLRDPLSMVCEEAQLTPPQMHTLVWLGQEGGLTMGELARRVSVTEKTVTGLVDRLERDELVHRERDALDRRVVHVRLTPRGTQHYRRIDAAIEESMVRFMGMLDPADRRALLHILDKLVERLGEPPEGSSTP